MQTFDIQQQLELLSMKFQKLHTNALTAVFSKYYTPNLKPNHGIFSFAFSFIQFGVCVIFCLFYSFFFLLVNAISFFFLWTKAKSSQLNYITHVRCALCSASTRICDYYLKIVIHNTPTHNHVYPIHLASIVFFFLFLSVNNKNSFGLIFTALFSLDLCLIWNLECNQKNDFVFLLLVYLSRCVVELHRFCTVTYTFNFMLYFCLISHKLTTIIRQP